MPALRIQIPQVGAEASNPHGVGPGALFSEDEKAYYRKRVDQLHTDLRPRWLWWLCGVECTMMLTAPPHEVREHFISTLNGINIMSGLVLSAIMHLAINPIPLTTLPVETLDLFGLEFQNYKQRLAAVYNILGVVCVVMQYLLCMYSTFWLGFVNSTPSKPELDYFFVLRGGPTLAIFTFILLITGYLQHFI